MLGQIPGRWWTHQAPLAEVRRLDAQARALRQELYVCAAMTDVKRPRTVAIAVLTTGVVRVQVLRLAQTLRGITHGLHPRRQRQAEARRQQHTREQAPTP